MPALQAAHRAGRFRRAVLQLGAPTEKELTQLGGVTFAVGERLAYHVDCHLRHVMGQWPAFAPRARFCFDGQTNIASAGATRRVRGFAPARGQCNCTGCGHYLPMGWTADVCAGCQSKAKAAVEGGQKS
jgi:hypothetical protein